MTYFLDHFAELYSAFHPNLALPFFLIRSESVRELETQLAEVDNKQAELDTKCTMMKALKEGHVPEIEQPEIPEPIIKTVEVLMYIIKNVKCN